MTKFINPSTVVAHLDLRAGQIVADLGCGSGFYAVPLAQMVGSSGVVYALDVQEPKLAATQSAARQQGLQNVVVMKADLDKVLLSLEAGSCDAVVAASIIHEVSSRETLLKNAYRLLKTGGQFLAVEWKKELTPLGPPLDKRVDRKELENLSMQLGFKKHKDVPADSFHYAVLFVK